jgi:O-acetyl-ADP-ribose deacetylase (regulator of RNase III)
LHRELAQRFGREAIFLASGSIQPGDDFVRMVFDSLRSCAVLLAVIGPHWLDFRSDAKDVGGFGDGHDWVHHEIAEAFELGIRVIPVLVEDAELPGEASLPPDIAALARCQYLRLRHYSIDSDLARLVDELGRAVPALSGGRAAAAGPAFFRIARASGRCRIGILPGTIRRVKCADIWVNSENTEMEMSRFTEFSISGIIRYWGARRDQVGRVVDDLIADELTTKIGQRRPVASGTAVVTGAGALTESNNVRHIIHVASVYGEPGAGFRQVREFEWCVANALAQAEQLAIADPTVRTILFPLLGTGTAGAQIEPTARTMLLAALDHLTGRPDTLLEGIYFLAYTDAELTAFDRILRDLPQLVPEPDDT